MRQYEVLQEIVCTLDEDADVRIPKGTILHGHMEKWGFVRLDDTAGNFKAYLQGDNLYWCDDRSRRNDLDFARLVGFDGAPSRHECMKLLMFEEEDTA